ncbi:MAG TPA: hypothetical protein V6C88_13785, partial [Chroococcidiopsis sp.]
MQRFTQLFQEIDATTSTHAKVDALRRYLRQETPDNAVWALYLLLGKTRKRLITSRVLRDIFLRFANIPEWLFEECYAQVGDSAEVIALLVQSGDRPSRLPADLPSADILPVQSLTLAKWMEEVLPSVKTITDDQTLGNLVMAWWSALSPLQVFILNKVLTGAFRMGVSEKLVIRAIANEYQIPEAIVAHRLMGDFEPTVAFFQRLTQLDAEEAIASPAQPYPFFLASPLEEDRFHTEDLTSWRGEWKWDGIRAQIIRRAGQVFIWSRGEDLVTEQFPEIATAFLSLPDGQVWDGELLCWDGQQPLSFNHLQKRLGRKRVTAKVISEYPGHFIAYDLLEHNGQD